MTLRKTTVRDDDGTLYVIPNSQITTVANLSIGYSVATVNVSVDFSANPDEVLKLLTTIAAEVRNSEEFRELFVADPQVLGVDAIKGSELIFPVVFKTLANQAIRSDARVPPPHAPRTGGTPHAARQSLQGFRPRLRSRMPPAPRSPPWKRRRPPIQRCSNPRKPTLSAAARAGLSPAPPAAPRRR